MKMIGVRDLKKRWQKIVLFVLLVFVVATLLQLITLGIGSLRVRGNKGNTTISYDQITTLNMQKEDYQIKATKNESIIYIKIPKQYIRKFQYTYTTNASFDARIKFYYTDGYGQEAEKVKKDRCLPSLQRSVINVNREVSAIAITVPKLESEITFTDFMIVNQISFNTYLYLFYLVVVFNVFWLMFYGRALSKRIEICFLVVVLTFGSLLIWIAPSNLTSWDEHIHFTKTYNMLSKEEAVQWPESYYFLVNNPEQSEIPYFNTIEENLDQIDYMNEASEYTNLVTKEPSDIRNVGYLLQAVFLQVGKLLQLPLYTVFMLGKFANLLLYAILGYFAIKKIAIGKMLMTAIALMPTLVYLTSTYNYDAMVNGFVFLAIAILVSELATPKEPMKIKDAILFTICIVLASTVKIVYIPLIIMGVFFPKSKFSNKKVYYIIKAIFVLGFFVLIAQFILPTLFAPEQTGDIRGGNTSNAGQLSLMLSHPFTYFGIFLKNFFHSFTGNMLGSDSLARLAYLDKWIMSGILPSFLMFIAVTDTEYVKNNKKLRIHWKHKIALVLCMCFMIGLTWTALYIDFTEVGAFNIDGVHPRYFIPMLPIVYLLFHTNKVKVNFEQSKYRSFIMGGMILILTGCIYELLIKHFIL